jgi:hypothetical protein
MPQLGFTIPLRADLLFTDIYLRVKSEFSLPSTILADVSATMLSGAGAIETVLWVQNKNACAVLLIL